MSIDSSRGFAPENLPAGSPEVDSRTRYNQADAKTMGDVNATVQALRGAQPDQVTTVLRDQIQQEMRDHYLSPGQLRCYTQALTEECTRQGLLNNVTINYESGHVVVDDKNLNTQTKVPTPKDYGPQTEATVPADTSVNTNPNMQAETREGHRSGRRKHHDASSVNPGEVPPMTAGQDPALRVSRPDASVVIVPAPTTVEQSRMQPPVEMGPGGGVPPIGVVPPPGVGPVDMVPRGASRPPMWAPPSPGIGPVGVGPVELVPPGGTPPTGVVPPNFNRPMQSTDRVVNGLTENLQDQQMQAKLEQERNAYLQAVNGGASGNDLQNGMTQMVNDERAFYASMRSHPENSSAQSQNRLNAQEQQWGRWVKQQEQTVIGPRLAHDRGDVVVNGMTETRQDQQNQQRLMHDRDVYNQMLNQGAPANQLQNEMGQIVNDSKAFHAGVRSRQENQDPRIQSAINSDEQQWIQWSNQQENTVIMPRLQNQQARQYQPQYPAPVTTQPYYPAVPGGSYYPPVVPPIYPPVVAPAYPTGTNIRIDLPGVFRIGR